MNTRTLSSDLAARWLQHNNGDYQRAKAAAKKYYDGVASDPAEIISTQAPRLAFRAGSGAGKFPQVRQILTEDVDLYEGFFPSLLAELTGLNSRFTPTVADPLQVLVVGCGVGIGTMDLVLTAQAAGIPVKATGIDIRPGDLRSFLCSIEIERELKSDLERAGAEVARLQELGLISFRAMIAEDLPADWTNQFHLVLSVKTFGYLYDQIGALEEAERVVRPGGKALIQIDLGSARDLLGRVVPVLARFGRSQGYLLDTLGQRGIVLAKSAANQMISGLVREPEAAYRPLTFPGYDHDGIIPAGDDYDPGFLALRGHLTIFDISDFF